MFGSTDADDTIKALFHMASDLKQYPVNVLETPLPTSGEV